jgi:nitrogen regulatory protein PII 2
MKKIIAIIRNECVEPSKAVLERLGITGVAVLHVSGRGMHTYRVDIPDIEFSKQQETYIDPAQNPELSTGTESPVNSESIGPAVNHGFFPQRMLIIGVNNEDVLPVVHALIRVNQSGRHGDGKIFVCPVVTAIEFTEGDNKTLS